MNFFGSLYSQHFTGVLNVISDSLSRDYHINDYNLISLLQRSFPQQAPKKFKISPLPPTIIFGINSNLLAMPKKAPEHLPQMPSSTGRGFAGSNSSPAPNSKTMNSSIILHVSLARSFSQLFENSRSRMAWVKAPRRRTRSSCVKSSRNSSFWSLMRVRNLTQRIHARSSLAFVPDVLAISRASRADESLSTRQLWAEADRS